MRLPGRDPQSVERGFRVDRNSLGYFASIQIRHPTARGCVANYDAHKTFLSDTSRYGVNIMMLGPLVADDGATMISSLFLIEAPGSAEVEVFSRADPFAAAGIWEKVTITGFLRRQG
nr:YciI family protein [Bradyrhizobium sp. CCBAU 53338]